MKKFKLKQCNENERHDHSIRCFSDSVKKCKSSVLTCKQWFWLSCMRCDSSHEVPGDTAAIAVKLGM